MAIAKTIRASAHKDDPTRTHWMGSAVDHDDDDDMTHSNLLMNGYVT